MITYFEKRHNSLSYRILSAFIAFTFIFSLVLPPGYAQLIPQTLLNLPAPGMMVTPTSGFTPAMVTGITIHPDNPLRFDFIMDRGQSGLAGEPLKEEYTKMIKYFMASLTVPEEELWVNLSPYEKDRMVPQGLGDTEMGRDMLAQDYLLKQLTASLMYPEKELGKEFWNKVYKEAHEKFGTTEIPVNTFNKVWIVPDEALVYEQGTSAFVIKSRLAVMLEEDYEAMGHKVTKSQGHQKAVTGDVVTGDVVTTGIIREVILPAIEQEINEGKNFANLRQIYNALILATWYKQRLKDSLLGKVYVDQNKTRGIDTQDKGINQKIYGQYIESFKKGVYNFIKEDVDPATREIIPRKYFSGGMAWKLGGLKTVGALALGTLLSFGSPDFGNASALAAAAMGGNKDGVTTEFVDNAVQENIGTAIVVKEGVQPILLAQAGEVASQPAQDERSEKSQSEYAGFTYTLDPMKIIKTRAENNAEFNELINYFLLGRITPESPAGRVFKLFFADVPVQTYFAVKQQLDGRSARSEEFTYDARDGLDLNFSFPGYPYFEQRYPNADRFGFNLTPDQRILARTAAFEASQVYADVIRRKSFEKGILTYQEALAYLLANGYRSGAMEQRYAEELGLKFAGTTNWEPPSGLDAAALWDKGVDPMMYHSLLAVLRYVFWGEEYKHLWEVMPYTNMELTPVGLQFSLGVLSRDGNGREYDGYMSWGQTEDNKFSGGMGLEVSRIDWQAFRLSLKGDYWLQQAGEPGFNAAARIESKVLKGSPFFMGGGIGYKEEGFVRGLPFGNGIYLDVRFGVIFDNLKNLGKSMSTPGNPASSPLTLEENINRVIEYTGRMHNLSNNAKRHMRKYLIAAVGDARNENKADEIFKNAMDNLTKEDYGSHFTDDVIRNSPRGIGHRRVIGLLFLTARKTLQPGSEFSFTAVGRWQYEIVVDSFLPQGNRYRITEYSDDTRRDLGLDKEASPSPASSPVEDVIKEVGSLSTPEEITVVRDLIQTAAAGQNFEGDPEAVALARTLMYEGKQMRFEDGFLVSFQSQPIFKYLVLLRGPSQQPEIHKEIYAVNGKSPIHFAPGIIYLEITGGAGYRLRMQKGTGNEAFDVKQISSQEFDREKELASSPVSKEEGARRVGDLFDDLREMGGFRVPEVVAGWMEAAGIDFARYAEGGKIYDNESFHPGENISLWLGGGNRAVVMTKDNLQKMTRDLIERDPDTAGNFLEEMESAVAHFQTRALVRDRIDSLVEQQEELIQKIDDTRGVIAGIDEKIREKERRISKLSQEERAELQNENEAWKKVLKKMSGLAADLRDVEKDLAKLRKESDPASSLVEARDLYRDFYDSFGAKNKTDGAITGKDVGAFSQAFLSPDAQLLPYESRRNNGTLGVTEVNFLEDSATRQRMTAFQQQLKAAFGDKVYLVDSDKLHFTIQGLETQWDDKDAGTKKELAMHSGLEAIDMERGVIREVRERARNIVTPSFKMQVAGLNWNPQTGIFWELRPYLAGSHEDPVMQRRKTWELPQPRPPHVTAAYFTQEFNPEDMTKLRQLVAQYQNSDYFGDIAVNNVEVIAYTDFSFNAGYKVLENVPLTASSPVGVATGMMGDEDGKEALMAFVEKTLAEDSAGYLLSEDVIRGLTHILIQRKHETPETLEILLSAIKSIVDGYTDVVLFSPADLNAAMKGVKNRYDSQYLETVRQLFEKIGEKAPDGEFTETFEQFTDIIESYLRSSGSSSPVGISRREVEELLRSFLRSYKTKFTIEETTKKINRIVVSFAGDVTIFIRPDVTGREILDYVFENYKGGFNDDIETTQVVYMAHVFKEGSREKILDKLSELAREDVNRGIRESQPSFPRKTRITAMKNLSWGVRGITRQRFIEVAAYLEGITSNKQEEEDIRKAAKGALVNFQASYRRDLWRMRMAGYEHVSSSPVSFKGISPEAGEKLFDMIPLTDEERSIIEVVTIKKGRGVLHERQAFVVLLGGRQLKVYLRPKTVMALEDAVKAGNSIENTVGEEFYRLDNETKDIAVVLDEVRMAGEGVDVSSSPMTGDTFRKGGIDLNPALLDLQIKRDGNGVPLPLPMQPIEHMHIEGFLPIIINVTPITNLPMLLGLADTEQNADEITPVMKAREPEEISALN